MTTAVLYGITGIVLFSLGLYALVVQRHFLRRLLSLNIMGTGVFMVFIASAWRPAPEPVDPVPHAFVLTGIVVAVSATGLGVNLWRRMQAEKRGEEAP